MKKGERKIPAGTVEDLDAFEDWEDVSSGAGAKTGTPKDPPAEPPQTEKPKVPKAPKAPSSPMAEEMLHMSSDVPVQLVAVVGRTTVSVKDMMNYQMGQVIDLGRPPGETVDIVASGKLFARGELVDIDGKLGVRIVKLVR